MNATRWTYRLRPIGRGNWKNIDVTFSVRVSIGKIIGIERRLYRVIDVIDVQP